MRSDSSTRQVWPVYGGPADVNGSDVVGCSREATRHAAKRVSIRTIAPLAMPTFGTRSGSVSGIDKENRNSGELRFVLDKAPKLRERPTMQRAPLAASSRNPLANALQVFEGNATIRVLRLAHDALGDCMVYMSSHPFFFLASLLQKALGCSALFRLKPIAHAGVTMTQTSKLSTAIDLPVRVSRDVLDAEVNPNPTLGCAGPWLLDLYRSEQVPLAFPIYKVGLASTEAQHTPSSFVANEPDALTAAHGPDGDLRVVVTEDAVVVGYRAERLESALPRLVELVRIGDLRDGSYYHLCRQTKAVLDVVVDEFVELVLAETLALPRNLADRTGRLVGDAKRLFKRVGLLLGGKKLYCDDQLHSSIIPLIFEYRRNGGERVFSAR